MPSTAAPATALFTAPHLDLIGGLKSVQLVEQLQHRALHLAVTAAAAVVCARAAD